MAYDAATSQVVLFGGYNGSGYLADTYTYQGTAVTAANSPVGTATPVSVYFNISAGGMLPALSNSNVLTQGAPAQEYTLGTGSTCTGAVTAGSTCSVNVLFKPAKPGQRLGAVNLNNASGTTLATALLSGTATGPAVAFPSTAAPVTLGSGLKSPYSVALDGAGDVFVADAGNNAVKEIVAVNGSIPASNPTIRTLGSGFSEPSSVRVDGAGNVFVTDLGHSLVKEIVAVNGSIPANNPTIQTLGSGFAGPEGLALDAAGDVFVADASNKAVYEIVAVNGVVSSSSKVNKLASTFSFGSPLSVAVDAAGDVFVSDPGNGAVYEIAAVNGSVPATNATVRSLGSFGYPAGIAVDAAGDVFVADDGSTAALYELVAVGGSIPATNPTTLTLGSNFGFTLGVALDGAGNVFVADSHATSVDELPLATPPAVSFSASVGNTGTGTLNLQNVGSTGLLFAVPATGTNPSLPSNYSYSSSGCPQLTTGSSAQTLASGGTCTATISFTPSMPSPTPGSLVFTDNNLNVANATQTVTLNGTGTAATGTTAQTITFPQPPTPVEAGSTATLTASSSSNLPIVYSVVSGPATLNGSTVTYTGAGTVVLEADQYGNNTYAAASSVQRTVTVADFVGSAAGTQTVTVTIVHGGTLGLIAVLTTGKPNLDFTYSSSQCVVGQTYAANSSCTVTYAFTPLAPGLRLGAVQLIDSTGAVIMGTTLISATATAPAVVFPSNNTVSKVGGANGNFANPFGVAVDAAGDVFVADYGNSAIKEIVAVNGVTSASSTVNTIGSGFSYPTGVAVDGAGDVFVADYFNSVVKEIVAVGGVTSASSTVNTVGSGFRYPSGVAVDGAGDVFVADSSNSVVKEIVAVKGVVSASSTVNTIGSGFKYPHGVAVDGTGDVFVADTGNSAIKEIVAVNGITSTSSTVNTIGSTNGGFNAPSGVGVDAAGNVFVADSSNNAIKEIVAANGVTSAGSSVNTLGGNFNGPYGVAVDSFGNVLVADTNNSAVEELPLATPPAISFADTGVGNSSQPTPLLVQNVGNAALTFPIPSAGQDPSLASGFTLSNNSNCPLVSSTSGSAGSLSPGVCQEFISFMPATGGRYNGSLIFTDNNLNATSGPATMQSVTLTGNGIVPPAANNQSVSVPFNTATSITLTATGTGTLTYTVATAPTHGTLSGTAPNLTYTPTANYQGADSFTFTAANSAGTSSQATVSITVSAGTPTANSQSVSTAFNTAVAITLSGTDPDSPALPLTYTVATAPTHGTLSGTAPNLTYTPAAGYAGVDSFTFRVSNGVNSSSAAAVNITVNDALASLQLSGIPSTVSPGVAQTLTVTAIGASGSTFTGFNGTVMLTSTDPAAALSPVSYTYTSADAGTHTFAVTSTPAVPTA